MGDNTTKPMLKVDAQVVLDQNGQLVSQTCREEVQGGDTRPDTVLSTKCSAEFAVLRDNPHLVTETVTLIQQCKDQLGEDPASRAKRCLEAVIQDKQRAVNHEVAERQVSAFCSEMFAEQGTAVNDQCRAFGNEYLHRDVDLTKTHGYDAADGFVKGINTLSGEAGGTTDAARKAMTASLLQMGLKIYQLGIQYEQMGIDRRKTFAEVIAHMLVVHQTAKMRAEAGAPQPKPTAVDESPRPSKEIESTPIPTSAPKAPLKSAEHEALELKVYASCEQLLGTYMASGHPVLKALKAVVPPVARRYLETYIRTKLRAAVANMGMETLRRALPSFVLGQLMQSLGDRAMMSASLVDDIARLHYQALGKDFEAINELGYSGKLQQFIYEGKSYRVEELPAAVRPLADVMLEFDALERIKKSPSAADKSQRDAMGNAQRWLTNAMEYMGYPADAASQAGKGHGLIVPVVP